MATPLYHIDAYATDLVGADTVHVSTEVLGAESVSYRRSRSATALRRDMVNDLKQAGIPILVYTVNHQANGSLARHLAEIGVDGLFTDDPGGLKSILGSGGPQE